MTKFTRGPVKSERIIQTEDGRFIAGLPEYGTIPEGNAELIAAAFNSATACESLGFDGLAAVNCREARSALAAARGEKPAAPPAQAGAATQPERTCWDDHNRNP